MRLECIFSCYAYNSWLNSLDTVPICICNEDGLFAYIVSIVRATLRRLKFYTADCISFIIS